MTNSSGGSLGRKSVLGLKNRAEDVVFTFVFLVTAAFWYQYGALFVLVAGLVNAVVAVIFWRVARHFTQGSRSETKPDTTKNQL